MQRRSVLSVLVAMVALAACGFNGVATAPEVAATDGGSDGPRVGLDGSSTDAPGDNDLPLPPADPRPSHLIDVTYDDKAADVTGLTGIDTGTPGTATANPSTVPPLPTGARFEIKGSDKIAVLIVGAWTVDKAIAVRGARALIVVAARSVTINAPGRIDAGGKGEQPGPGGFAAGTGDGRGKDGAPGAGSEDSGGGGASFGSLGAVGGATVSGTQGGAAGVVYGDNPALFLGGSPGGDGSPVADCRPLGSGGGGGGAIQISALVSINVAESTFIHAGGGGGRGGCESTGKAGGGGGSGGTIFLESPTITIAGTLASNGGAGGGGGSGDAIGGFDAQSGENAGIILPAIDAARGGSNPAQGSGGDGAIEGTAATKGQTASFENNQGGGGGGMGRIWLRTFGVKGATATPPITSGARISPAHKIAP